MKRDHEDHDWDTMISAAARGIESLCPICEGSGLHRYCLAGLDEDETGYEMCPACGGSGLKKG